MKKTEKVKCLFDNIKSIYEGEVVNGKFNGYGVLKSIRGTYFEGNFKDSKFEGKGIYTDILNTFDKFHTLGKSFDLSQTRISGSFKKNLIFGFADIFYPNGDYTRVEYKNGKIDGSVNMLLDEGSNHWKELWKKGTTDEAENLHYNQMDTGKYIKKYQHEFVRKFEKEFEEYGWYPNLLCPSKEEFKKKLEVWREKYPFPFIGKI
jgi:hypothetical protein